MSRHVTVRIPEYIYEWIQYRAKLEHRTVSNVVIDTLALGREQDVRSGAYRNDTTSDWKSCMETLHMDEPDLTGYGGVTDDE